MKVLIVNSYDNQGGAARAAMRLHKALLNYGVNSEMLVQNKIGDDETVVGPVSKKQKALVKLRSLIDQLPLKFYKNRSSTHFSPSLHSFSNIVDEINKRNADIVHLHWINEGMIPIENLAKINAPIVWTLHDMWPFTGGCHYSDKCTKYKNKCGSCIILGSITEKDLSRKIYKKKLNAYSKIEHLTIIGLSNWLNSCSKSSSLFNNRTHINLPNPIDTDTFKPIDKDIARSLWNLPKDKKLILFGAMSATSDPRKGFDELNQALKKINSQDVELVVFGSSKPKQSQNFSFRTHYLGRINDDTSLITLYNAVDMLVSPSLEENLSNVIMESLSCGTPVVAFDIGGNSDMIEHKINGYLAKNKNTKEFAEGIDFILSESTKNKMRISARKKIIAEFNEKKVAKKYINIYMNEYKKYIQ